MNFWAYCCLYFVLFVGRRICASDQSHEELLLRPLADGSIMLHFQFTTSKDLSEAGSALTNNCNNTTICNR